MTEIGNGDLPSLRSREGPGVSMYEIKEPNEVASHSQLIEWSSPTSSDVADYIGRSPKANSLWKRCV